MERDDDALAWDGDDDPTLDAPKRAERLPDGYAAVGRGSAGFERDAAPASAAEAEPQPGGMSNAALLALGVFGGVYLLYTVGWVIGGLRLEVFALAAVAAPLYVASLLLAVSAPAIWFAATYLLTRDAKTWVRMVWLVAGVLLLLPWPFLMVGAVGT